MIISNNQTHSPANGRVFSFILEMFFCFDFNTKVYICFCIINKHLYVSCLQVFRLYQYLCFVSDEKVKNLLRPDEIGKTLRNYIHFDKSGTAKKISIEIRIFGNYNFLWFF